MRANIRRKSFGQYLKENYALYLMCIPGLIYVIGYKFLPLIGLQLAFKKYNMFAGNGLLDSMFKSKWVGLTHFEKIFHSDEFWLLLNNTVSISLLKMVILFPLPILLAILMNEMHSIRFKRSVQTLIYLPHFLSWVIIHGIFSTLLSNSGVINNFLVSVGLPRISLYTDPKLFRSLLIFTEGWKESGWGAIVYLAALTSIDPQLYEAAVVDGAGKWRCLWSITLPSIIPTIITMLLLRMGSIFNVGFEKAFLLQSPSTYETSEIISTYVYTQGLQSNSFSYGTAVGLFNSIVSLSLVLISNYVAKSVSETSLW